MEDVRNSRARARVSQGWKHGQYTRYGDPFHSREERLSPWTKEGVDTALLLEYLSHYNEKYPTPENIKIKDFDEILKFSEDILLDLWKVFVPFLNKEKWLKETTGTALMRCQDYAFIKTYAEGLKKGCSHLDIGPGLGAHALYSLKALEANYIGIEAQPNMYTVQRLFQRFFSSRCQTIFKDSFNFFDCIDAESFGQSWDAIGQRIKKNQSSPGIQMVPSWMFKLIPEKSIDLVTATFMLNEVPIAAILWFFSNCTRVMKKGSYFYINDNAKQKDEIKLKPERINAMDYDQFLLKLGFKEVKRMNMENRVNYRGSPRIYKKDFDKHYSYDELADMKIGKFAVTKYS